MLVTKRLKKWTAGEVSTRKSCARQSSRWNKHQQHRWTITMDGETIDLNQWNLKSPYIPAWNSRPKEPGYTGLTQGVQDTSPMTHQHPNHNNKPVTHNIPSDSPPTCDNHQPRRIGAKQLTLRDLRQQTTKHSLSLYHWHGTGVTPRKKTTAIDPPTTGVQKT